MLKKTFSGGGHTERCERPFGPALASQPRLAHSTGEDVSVCDVASRPALPRPRPRPQPLSPSLRRRQEAKPSLLRAPYRSYADPWGSNVFKSPRTRITIERVQQRRRTKDPPCFRFFGFVVFVCSFAINSLLVHMLISRHDK